MEKDPFKEYIRQSEPAMRDKGYVWHTAIGLQAVDGLSPSKYLEKFDSEKVFGRKDMTDALGITESPASELIRKLVEIEIIVPVQGKGRYMFSI